MVTSVEAAVESLRQIKSTEPPLWLLPKQGLSQAVRAASKHLFSILKPHSPKSPFDQLLIEGFDAEQIWQQIDLQSQPLLSTLRREVKKFEKHPEDISKLKEAVEGGNKENGTDNVDDEDGGNDDDMDVDEDDDNDNDEGDDDDEEDAEEEDEGKEKERGREEENEREGEEKGWIEDKFLKIKELQEYLEEDEAREFGLKKRKTKRETKKDEEDTELEDDDEEEEKDDEEDDEAEEEEDDLGLFDGDDEDKLENARF